MPRKIAVFMGTRPEAIKMAPVIKALEAHPSLEPLVVSTGQHKEMLAQVVSLFDLSVDHDLEVMQPNQTLASLTARLMTRIDNLLTETKPDFALVQGDTTTVLVAALACFYHKIPIGHVEAGLRTGNIWSPFPEEANRKLASPLVTLHFPPTDFGKQNLIKEGIEENTITVTGNTVIDALQMEVRRQASEEARKAIDTDLIDLLGEGWRKRPYVLITGHRRENFGEGFGQICQAMRTLAERYRDHDFIYPVHLNPNVQGPVYDLLGNLDNIKLIPPQGYSNFVALMNACKMVLTDSGGVQEEAPGLGKPVLVMRDTTERPEGVDAGTVKLVGANAENIIRHADILLSDESAYLAMADAVNPYGEGNASPQIAEAIDAYFAANGS